jgi:hypothetical protein
MAYTTINDPSEYFNTLLYTGTGANGNAVIGNGFQPDWVWAKSRSNTGHDHHAWDSSRGTGGKDIYPNENFGEGSDADRFSAFGSDGFTVGGAGHVNTGGDSYVSWNWKANGGTTSTNTDGSQNTTVQVNSTAGFSIVKRTGTGSAGATYGHGLGAVPDVIINKGLNTNEWYSYFKAIGGGTHWMNLDGTNAAIDDANMWNDTNATSTVFTVGNSGGSNGSSVEYIAYCFKEIQGYSKFGSYTGNGDANGPFIYLGFKPAWVMFKNLTAGHDWRILDNKRNTFNSNNKDLRSNTSEIDSAGSDMDFVSNGIKMRDTDGDLNESGSEHFYMAFAESPFVTSNGGPNNAR